MIGIFHVQIDGHGEYWIENFQPLLYTNIDHLIRYIWNSQSCLYVFPESLLVNDSYERKEERKKERRKIRSLLLLPAGERLSLAALASAWIWLSLMLTHSKTENKEQKRPKLENKVKGEEKAKNRSRGKYGTPPLLSCTRSGSFFRPRIEVKRLVRLFSGSLCYACCTSWPLLPLL